MSDATAPSTEGVDRSAHPYRMKDLCEKTGLPRQVIHFYIQQGLVPEGHKTGRNMAYYGEAHLERLLLVRKLQHERFLPLKAIRAVLEERDEVFSPAQRALLRDVKVHLSGSAVAPERPRERVAVGPLLERYGVTTEDFAKLVELGFLGVADDAEGRAVIAADDAWMLETFGELRALGFSEALGFSAADLAVLEEPLSLLFQREAALLSERIAHLSPEQVARMVEKSLPLINTFLVKYHEAKIRNFFAAL